MQATPAATWLENRCFDEIRIGDSDSIIRTLSREDIEVFAILSGDVNPAHLDEAYAQTSPFHKVIAHGMWGGTLISTVLGTRLPGPGTIYVRQSLAFLRPVGVGDVITVTVTVREKLDRNRLLLDCICSNQHGKPVISGEAEVIAPDLKVRREVVALPDLKLYRHARFGQLMARVQGLSPARCAVIHPLAPQALQLALAARQAGLIEPVLVGPRSDIEGVARSHGIDLEGVAWVDAPELHGAMHQALAMVRRNEAEVLMQGGAPTLPLLQALMAPEHGLRGAQRLTHVSLADVPGRDEPLLITDAALNIEPTLQAKRDIAQNAIDLALRMGLAPRLAVLSAAQGASRHLVSAQHAQALCDMASQGQLRGGLVDGPMSLDTAISPQAAALQQADSPVAGRANILLVPNLESGDLMVKQLVHLAQADVAGLVLGASAPVVLDSPSDPRRNRLASVALALLQARTGLSGLAATP